MTLFQNIKLPDTPALRAARLYLEAEASKDFSNSAAFFSEGVVFHGLILKVDGRERVATEMQNFLSAAIDYIKIEAIAEVAPNRVLALYWFKMHAAPSPQILCDHLTVVDGKITRIENVFDVSKLPMPPA